MHVLGDILDTLVREIVGLGIVEVDELDSGLCGKRLDDERRVRGRDKLNLRKRPKQIRDHPALPPGMKVQVDFVDQNHARSLPDRPAAEMRIERDAALGDVRHHPQRVAVTVAQLAEPVERRSKLNGKLVCLKIPEDLLDIADAYADCLADCFQIVQCTVLLQRDEFSRLEPFQQAFLVRCGIKTIEIAKKA